MDRLVRGEAGMNARVITLICLASYSSLNCKAAQHTTRGYNWARIQDYTVNLLLPEKFILTAWSAVTCTGSCTNTPGCDVVLYNLLTRNCTAYEQATSQAGPLATIGELSSEDIVALKGTPFGLLPFFKPSELLDWWIYISSTTESWDDAITACNEGGGRLAELDMTEKLSAIIIYLTNNKLTSDTFWIGGRKEQPEDWKWNNGGDIFEIVVEQDLNANCLTISVFNSYQGFECEDKFKFICEKI